jgi:hypothetical protein
LPDIKLLDVLYVGTIVNTKKDFYHES